MLWDQHLDRFTVGNHTARRITYCKFRELTASMSAEDIARIGRLNAKRESGATLSAEEQTALQELLTRWPIDELRGACMVPPMTAGQVRDTLARMPRAESEDLELILDRCIVPDIPEGDVSDPLALQLVLRGGLGIPISDMTVGQGMALAAMLAPKEGQ